MTQTTDPTRPYNVGLSLRGRTTLGMRCADVRPGSGDWLQLVDVDPSDLDVEDDLGLPGEGGVVLNVHPTMLTGPIVVRRVIPRQQQQRPADPTVEDLTAPFAKQAEVYRDYAATIPRVDPEQNPLPDPLGDEALEQAAAGIVRAAALDMPSPEAFREAIESINEGLRGVARDPLSTLETLQPSRELLRAPFDHDPRYDLEALDDVKAHGVMIIPAEVGDSWQPPEIVTTTRVEVAQADTLPGLAIGDDVILWTAEGMVPTVHLGIRTWADVATIRSRFGADRPAG